MNNLSAPLRRCTLCGARTALQLGSSGSKGAAQYRVGSARSARRISQYITARAVQTETLSERSATAANSMPSTSTPVNVQASPGALDDERFQQDWSVQYWRDWKIPADIRDENLPVTRRSQNILRHMSQAAQRARVFESAQSIAYWSYHLGRLGFFATQGLAGVAFSSFMNGSNNASQSTSGGSGEKRREFFNVANLLRSGIYIPLGEALAMFNQDYENIRRGIYKMPWDATTPAHQQTNPLNIMDKAFRFFREASVSLKRRSAGKPDAVWLESGLYPEYYLNTWHYQTDGWLSEDSAKVYETSTETVFVGRQDAMQRQSLVPLRDLVRQQGASDGSGLQLIDIGSGTGRFATFVKDNYPKMGVSQLDLSPFYLNEARKNLDYWRRRRGGSRPEDTVASRDRFLHGPAEKIPAPDASFHIAVSIYLFHELPDTARQAAISEMWRILKPGGMAILTDGNQLGDRPINDKGQGNFQAFNEPNWGTHIALDYGTLFSAAGFVPHKKVLASGTKVLSFTKPQE